MYAVVLNSYVDCVVGFVCCFFVLSWFVWVVFFTFPHL